MLVPKTIRIIQGRTPDGQQGLAAEIEESARCALKYEKSVRILADGPSEKKPNQPRKRIAEKADFIMPIGAPSPAQLKRHDTGVLAEITVPEPGIHPCALDHPLNLGESLHGYFTRNGDLLSLHHLPAVHGKLDLNAPSLMAAPSIKNQELANTLQAKFGLHGPWHAVATGPNALELHSYAAPRLTPLFSALGLNWYALLVFEAMEKPISILRQKIKGTIAFNPGRPPRLQLTFDRLYLDLDDTLIIHGAVNPHAMQLLEDCRQQNIAVHLITRHAGNLPKTLKTYKIDEPLFASVIWIKDQSPKSSHMKPGNAIFIDDSYQERVEVCKELAIPSYSQDVLQHDFWKPNM